MTSKEISPRLKAVGFAEPTSHHHVYYKNEYQFISSKSMEEVAEEWDVYWSHEDIEFIPAYGAEALFKWLREMKGFNYYWDMNAIDFSIYNIGVCGVEDEPLIKFRFKNNLADFYAKPIIWILEQETE